MPEIECCSTCKNRLDLHTNKYINTETGQEVEHTIESGLLCLAFASEGVAVHMIGDIDPDYEHCEAYCSVEKR